MVSLSARAGDVATQPPEPPLPEGAISGTVTRVPASVEAARALLPRVYAGEDVSATATALADRARSQGDVPGACAALYTLMAAGSISHDRARAHAAAAEVIDLAVEHHEPSWEATGRQYLARLQLIDGHEEVALTEVVTAELLVDDAPVSIELAVALNGIGLAYSRMGLFEDGERTFARLVEVIEHVDDPWALRALTYNRLLNQAAWGLSLERNASRNEARKRLEIAAVQARGFDSDMTGSQARHDFGALCLFTDLMVGQVTPDVARERLDDLGPHVSAEPLSFLQFGLAHELANHGRLTEAREAVTAGLTTLRSLAGEPVRSMLIWERARIAVLGEPDHTGLRDAWDYARLATAQVWELRVRRREAARDRLRIGRMRRDHERVEQASLEDPLTGTANRRRIDRERAGLLEAPQGTWVTVGYLDIDGFKAVNDTHGHDLGDAVLRDLAGLLEACTRDTDLIGRYGGDEFVVVAPGCGPNAAERLAREMLEAVRRHPWERLHPELAIRVSFGLATTRAEYHRLFPSADEALYDAKRGGRDRAERRVLDPRATDHRQATSVEAVT